MAALTIHTAAAADDAAPLRRTTISLLANGKEVAGLVLLPGQGKRTMSWSAIRQEERPDGSLYLSGHVTLTLTLENAAPVTLHGDDLTITSADLDAEQARALNDLKQMGVSDQSIRANPAAMSAADAARQQALDTDNMKRLAQIIARYGWPGVRFAGAYAQNAFLVLQHADVATQQTYLPLLRAAAARGDVPAADLAMLEDRVLVQQGKPQLYGTQFMPAKPLKQYAVADAAHLDDRRRAVGLPPMDEYLQMMKATYGSE